MKMEEKAATDEMTGLYNKNKLLATIEKRTYDYQQVAIVYWDINRLKYVNDTSVSYTHLTLPTKLEV